MRPTDKADAQGPSRLWLAIEYLFLFFLLPLVYVAGWWPWPPMLLLMPSVGLERSFLTRASGFLWE